jgi:DNA polymerase-3 subunit epsilon
LDVVSWSDGRIVAYDCETTGVDPETARIVSAAVAFVGGGEPTETWTITVNPGIEIPEEASSIHGVTTEIAQRDGVDSALAIQQIWTQLQRVEPGWPLAIFNARFDLTVLNREMTRHDLIAVDETTFWVVDPLVIDKHIQRYRSGSRKLDATCLHYGAELTAAHDPAHDALAAARLAWRIARTGEVVRRVRDWREESELKRLREDWEAVRNAVRPKVEAKVREVYGDRLDENLVSALGLLDRMLPSEPLKAPAVDHAEILFPMQQELS